MVVLELEEGCRCVVTEAVRDGIGVDVAVEVP